MTGEHNQIALVTGGSEGLGLELVRELSGRGWTVVTDARDSGRLHDNVRALPGRAHVRPIAGDLTDAAHRADLVAEAGWAGWTCSCSTPAPSARCRCAPCATSPRQSSVTRSAAPPLPTRR